MLCFFVSRSVVANVYLSANTVTDFNSVISQIKKKPHPTPVYSPKFYFTFLNFKEVTYHFKKSCVYAFVFLKKKKKTVTVRTNANTTF